MHYKCINCGAPIKANQTACEYCGTKIINCNQPYKFNTKSEFHKADFESLFSNNTLDTLKEITIYLNKNNE